MPSYLTQNIEIDVFIYRLVTIIELWQFILKYFWLFFIKLMILCN